MCSWCYGFGPELDAFLLAHPGARVDLVTGGLRAGNEQLLDVATRDTILGHWEHVRQATGLPFAATALQRPGFVYDTEPACRAVVVVRSQASGRTLAYFKAVQNAFYAEGRDVTQEATLVEVAEECGLDAGLFRAAWNTQAARDAARRDFATSVQLGVQGFPTLALQHADSLYLVANGFTRSAELAERVARIEALADPAK